MLLNLLVAELEYLQTLRERSLGCLSVCKVVDDLLVRESLFDVIVVEVDNRVSVRESLSSNSVAKNNFFLSIQICALDFAIVTHNLVLDCRVLRVSSAVILLR